MQAEQFIDLIEKAYADGTIPKGCSVGEIYGSIRSTLLRQKTNTGIKAEFLDSVARKLINSESLYSANDIANGVRFWVKVWAEFREMKKSRIVDSWECEYKTRYDYELFRYEVRADENYVDLLRRATVCYNWNNRNSFGVCGYEECEGLKFKEDRILKVTASYRSNVVTKDVELNNFIKPDYPIGFRFFRKRGVGIKDLDSVQVELAGGSELIAQSPEPPVQAAPAKKPNVTVPQKVQVAPKVCKSGVPHVFRGNVPQKARGSFLGVAWGVLIVGIVAFGVYAYLSTGTKTVKVERHVSTSMEEPAADSDKHGEGVASVQQKPRFHALGYSKVISKQAPVYRTREDAVAAKKSAGSLAKGKRVYIVEVDEMVCAVKSSPESQQTIWMSKGDIAPNSQKK